MATKPGQTTPRQPRRIIELILILACMTFPPAVSRGVAETDVTRLSSADFLNEVRRPFRQDAWGQFSGRISHKGKAGRHKGSIDLAIRFAPESTKAQLVSNGQNIYNLQEKHGVGTAPQVSLALPANEKKPGLFDMGIEAEDLTFAFIYWDLLRELPRDSVRGRKCRVMDLAHPADKGYVRVWFSEAHFFPLRVHWFHNEQDKPWRTLNVKGVKKHDDNFWFLKTLELRGDGWKTQVRFDEAEMHASRDMPPPAGLFRENQAKNAH